MILGRYLKKRGAPPPAVTTGDSATTPSMLSGPMLAGDGPLGGFPDPVATVRRDGSIVASNEAARRIAALFAAEGPLRDLIGEVADARTDRNETIESGTGEGAWRVTLHPLPDGETVLVHAADVTPDRTLRDTLVESRERYKELVEISADFVWETGPGGRFSFVSPAGALGHAPDQLIDRDPAEFIAAAELLGAGTPFATRTDVADVDVWFHRADGELALLQTSARPKMGADGTWIGARGVCRDVTEVHRRDAALAAAERRERLLAYIIRSANDEPNPAHMLGAAAAATAKALGATNCRIYRRASAGGMTVAAEHGKPPVDDGLDGKLLLQATEDGEPIMAADADRHMMCGLTTYRKAVNGAMAVVRPLDDGAWSQDDVTLFRDLSLQLAIAIEQFDHHRALEALSRTDELTELLNRRAFFGDLETRLKRRRPKPGPGALLYVDLDNFKRVNDVHGHHRGDEALRAVAELLIANTRSGDLVGRIGGDEFALWLDRTDETAAIARAKELVAASDTLAQYSGDAAAPLGISLGIAPWVPGDLDTVTGLGERADAAMYQIKRGDKGGYAVAKPSAEASEKPVTKPAAKRTARTAAGKKITA
jgi:diguanylate cyclase (GGDEF)-like protein/PAS domain S-box-containing protein